MTTESITVLCNCRFPSTAAHSAYLARLCESLSGRGVQVELVVPKRFKEVSENPFKYYSVKKPFTIKKIWSFDFLIFGSVLGRLAFIMQYANFYLFVLCFFLFRSRKQVIYTMDNLGCLLKFLGYKVIFETHIGIGSYRQYLLSLLKKADKVVTVNNIIKNDFVRAGFQSENILVAPNGVDLSLFTDIESKDKLRKTLKLPIGSKIVAYVGKYKTMGMDKGVDGLVQAFGSLYSTRKDIHLLVVGLSEAEKKELGEVVKRAGVFIEAFTLVSHVSNTDVAKFMTASDVLVMNYPNTTYYANFMSPMKMFEYMAAKRPIVTSNLPAIREILDKESAVFVESDDEESLKRGIEKLLNDELFGVQISSKAYEKVLNYTWEKRAERILDFIS